MNNALVCPICRSDQLTPWGNRNGIELYKCEHCTHRFADVGTHSLLDKDPDQFRMRFTHNLMPSDDAYYRHLCLGEREGEHLWKTTGLILRELEFLDIPAGRKWLDIGCGSGYLVNALVQRGWDAVGLEPGGWGQIAAREKGIRVIQGALDQHTFPAPFDCISATDVLEHQPDPRRLLQLIRHYLTSAGFAFVSIPYADSFHGRLIGHRWAMVEPPTHSQFFTRRSFEMLLDDLGFSLERLIQFNVSYPPVLGRLPAGRAITDWALRAVLGGDQALLVFRLRPTAPGNRAVRPGANPGPAGSRVAQ